MDDNTNALKNRHLHVSHPTSKHGISNITKWRAIIWTMSLPYPQASTLLLHILMPFLVYEWVLTPRAYKWESSLSGVCLWTWVVTHTLRNGCAASCAPWGCSTTIKTYSVGWPQFLFFWTFNFWWFIPTVPPWFSTGNLAKEEQLEEESGPWLWILVWY